MKQSFTKLHRNEDGFVAIVVTMIIMIVLTLIVTGFAQLARREQREALDRQLNTQALYAAESGINDARRALKLDTTLEKPNCGGSLPGATSSNLEASGSNIQYSCLLITQKLTDYPFQDVQVNDSTVVPITPDAALNNLVISWQKQDAPTDSMSAAIGGGVNLPPVGNWGNNISVMRIDLVPVPSTGFTNADLKNNVFTAFLYPSNSGAGTVAYTNAPGEQGQIVNADCSNPANKRKCRVTITGLSGNYYLRWKSLYTVSDLDLCGNNCDGTVHFSGLQAQIDSTGKANDVLKRIQVRVPVVPKYTGLIFTPDYALDSSSDICKLFSVWPAGGDASTCATAVPGGGHPIGGGPGAGFSSNCIGGPCVVDPGNGGTFSSTTDPGRWKINLTNRTSNSGLSNVSCLWDFGDGHTSTQHCQDGDYFQYSYDTSNLNCNGYTVNLTVKFSDGSEARAKPDTFWIPLNGVKPNGDRQFDQPCN